MTGITRLELIVLSRNLAGILLLLLILLYLSKKEKNIYLQAWTKFWGFASLGFVGLILVALFPWERVFFLIFLLNHVIAVLYLLKGINVYLQREMSLYWRYSALAVSVFSFGAIWLVGWIYSFTAVVIFLGAAYFWGGILLGRSSSKFIIRATGGAGLGLGIMLLIYPVLSQQPWFALYSNVILGGIGLFFGVGLVGLHYERLQVISQKKEEKLAALEEQYRTIFEKSPLGMLLLDEKGKVLKVNQTLCDYSGYSREELEDNSIFSTVVPDKYEEAARKNIEQVLEGEDLEYIGESISKDGEVYNILFKETKINLPSGRPAVLSMQLDYTTYKEQQDKIEYLTFHDSLTGLYNRTFMEVELDRLDTPRQLPLSLIMIDVNGLKIINDSFGHKKGDELLIKVAEALEEVARDEDIITRWGGDEFLIILPQTDKDDAEKIGQRIESYCTGLAAGEIPVSLSIGIGVKTETEEKIEAVINEADRKMYQNKRTDHQFAKNKMIQQLLEALYAKSEESEAHVKRMKALAESLGKRVELTSVQLKNLSLLIELHDIGEVTISEKTLTKPTSLTESEWELIKEHPQISASIAANSEKYAPVVRYLQSYHEHWDGRGYPDGMAGEDIPLLARICALVDAYDVMIHGRAYQEPKSKEAAVAEIKNCAGSQFDPELAQEFLQMLEE